MSGTWKKYRLDKNSVWSEYKCYAIKAAKELGYPYEFRRDLELIKDDNKISRMMLSARDKYIK